MRDLKSLKYISDQLEVLLKDIEPLRSNTSEENFKPKMKIFYRAFNHPKNLSEKKHKETVDELTAQIAVEIYSHGEAAEIWPSVTRKETQTVLCYVVMYDKNDYYDESLLNLEIANAETYKEQRKVRYVED